MSAHEVETAVEAEFYASERNDGISTGFSPDMIEEKSRRALNCFTLKSLP